MRAAQARGPANQAWRRPRRCQPRSSSYDSLAGLFAKVIRRAIQLEFPDQCAARYTEQIRRLLLMAAGLRQYSSDRLLLQAVERIFIAGQFVLTLDYFQRQIGWLDLRSGREQDRLVQRIPELADVTWPGVI